MGKLCKIIIGKLWEGVVTREAMRSAHKVVTVLLILKFTNEHFFSFKKKFRVNLH